MFTKPNHNTIVLLNLYRPPSGNLSRTINHIITFLSDLTYVHRRAELFVVGDLNVDLLLDTTNSNDILEVCYQACLISLINRPTRFGLYSSTCIDICWTNSSYIFNVRHLRPFASILCPKETMLLL